MFYLAGIIITFFLSALLAGKKGKSYADKILAIWLMVIGLHLLLFYLYKTGQYFNYPYLLGIDIPLPLMHGPFIYLYTISLTKTRRAMWSDLLHFTPVMIVYVLMLSFFQLSGEEKIYVYKNQGRGFEWLTDNLFYFILASGIIYVVLSFLELRKHKVNIENQFSNTEKINLNWLRYLIYGTSVIWLVIIAGFKDQYIFSTVVLYVFFIGYFGIRQTGVFTNKKNRPQIQDLPSPVEDLLLDHVQEKQVEKVKEELKEEEADVKVIQSTSDTNNAGVKIKYQKSSLNNETALRIHDQLTGLMKEKKLFKDPDVNLGDLADQLEIHANTLSQVINSFEKKNFYDYINDMRVAEFKKMLIDPENEKYTLLSLAFECGFNSKTAFNRNFKKATGQSPSEFFKNSKAEPRPI